jgi:HlyD family secretion protein
VGFVVPGQAAQIKVAAYPFQKYGLLTGHVVHLSADAADPQSAARAVGLAAGQTPPLAYRATIALSSNGLRPPHGETLRMTPGLAVTAEIHQGRRSVMEYLLSPVTRIANDAARER